MAIFSQYARQGFISARRGRDHNPWPAHTFENREFARGVAMFSESVRSRAKADEEARMGPLDLLAAGEAPRTEPAEVGFTRLALRFAQLRPSTAQAKVEEGRALQAQIIERHPGLALWLFHEIEPYPAEETT